MDETIRKFTRILNDRKLQFPLLVDFLNTLFNDQGIEDWNPGRLAIIDWDSEWKEYWQNGNEHLRFLCGFTGFSAKVLALKYKESLLLDQAQYKSLKNEVTLDQVVKEVYNDPFYPIIESLEFLFDKSAVERFNFNNECLKSIGHLFKKGFFVCELGIGSGFILNSAITLLPNQPTFTSVDISLSPISFIKDKFMILNIQRPFYVCANIHDLPFINNQFDLVLANEVVEHISEPLVALKEISRLTKIGGYAVISTSIGYPSIIHLKEFDSINIFFESIVNNGFEIKNKKILKSNSFGNAFFDIFTLCKRNSL